MFSQATSSVTHQSQLALLLCSIIRPFFFFSETRTASYISLILPADGFPSLYKSPVGRIMYVSRNTTFDLCISQFHLRPGPPPGLTPGISIFLPWMANSRAWGLLSWQIPRGGEENRGQMPRSPSTVQHFLSIAQSNSAILKCDFLFQLTSSFVIALGF